MMIILDAKEANWSMVGRYVELYYLLQANNAHAVSFIENASLSKMKKGEKLFLLGHGDPGSLGAWILTPAELAATLLNKGLDNNTYVVLGSCSGGVTPNGGTSYFVQFVAQVWEQGAIRIEGEAYTGATSITPQGTYEVLDPALDNVHTQQAYGQILTNNRFELDRAARMIASLHKKPTSTPELLANVMTEMTTTINCGSLPGGHSGSAWWGDVRRVTLTLPRQGRQLAAQALAVSRSTVRGRCS
jgi:hypothetical protein